MTDFIKNNILLCEFDGKEYRQPNDQDICLFDYENNLIDYSSDWNLLMGVCKKIDNSYNEDASESVKEIFTDLERDIDIKLATYEIIPVFEKTVKFIEWYNFQLK